MLTERCNFKCVHCCYSCTAKGKDMSFKTFEAAMKLDSWVSLGGGEPTLHPDFCKFLGFALAECEDGVWLATNGSQTKTILALAKMAKAGIVGVALSLDGWHDPIDPAVEKAFTKDYVHRPFGNDSNCDLRQTRSVDEENLSWTGRARKNFNKSYDDHCPCEDLFISPNGDIHQCGCPDAPKIGSVFKSFDREEFVDSNGDLPCWSKSKQTKIGTRGVIHA